MTVIERTQSPQLAFPTKQGIRLGLEAELVIPFDKYKWGILFEPTFQSFKTNKVSDSKNESATISYNSIEFPIGLRYYIYITDNTRFYLNAFLIPGLSINLGSKIEYTIAPDESTGPNNIISSSNVAFGGGFDHKRFSFEARYYSSRNISKDEFTFNASSSSTDYSRFSIILGYRFMEKKLK